MFSLLQNVSVKLSFERFVAQTSSACAPHSQWMFAMYDNNRVYEIISKDPFDHVVEILYMFFITFLTRSTAPSWDARARNIQCLHSVWSVLTHTQMRVVPSLYTPAFTPPCLRMSLWHIPCVTLASIILLNVLLAVIVAAWDEVNNDRDEQVILIANPKRQPLCVRICLLAWDNWVLLVQLYMRKSHFG